MRTNCDGYSESRRPRDNFAPIGVGTHYERKTSTNEELLLEPLQKGVSLGLAGEFNNQTVLGRALKGNRSTF